MNCSRFIGEIILEFKITNIEKHHKSAIHKLIKEINREDNLNYSLTDEWLDYVIQNAGGGIFLGFHGEELAGLGTAMINPVYKEQASLNVIVSPDYRRKGLASILYDEIYEFAKGEGVKIVEAYVKNRLGDGVRFAEKRAFSASMYSWEMELNLDSVDFTFKELLGLSFRRATKVDGYNYRKIIHDAFGDEVGEDALIEILRDPSIIIYILEKGNQAIGSATVQLRKDLSLAYIYDIAILKDHRRQGLGSYILQSSIIDLREEDIHKASLLVTGENRRALELYRKIGFKEVDIDLIMVKRVE